MDFWRDCRYSLYCGAASKHRKVILLTEDQKIRQTIDQYSSYFENSDADVGHTKKGVWFFYEYDKEHDYSTRHSLSVSDIKEVKNGESAGFYFCDSIGFKKVPFHPEQTQKADNVIRILVVEPHRKPY